MTDLAARGIDIPLLDYVVNFDFPSKPKIFVHRVGRVARAGRSGVAFSLVSPDEVAFMIELHLFLGKHLLNEVEEGQAYDENEVYFGTMPTNALQLDTEYLAREMQLNPDLSSQYKVMQNAYKLYYKTRERQSAESVRRAKLLRNVKVHPYFLVGPGKDHSMGKGGRCQKVIYPW